MRLRNLLAWMVNEKFRLVALAIGILFLLLLAPRLMREQTPSPVVAESSAHVERIQPFLLPVDKEVAPTQREVGAWVGLWAGGFAVAMFWIILCGRFIRRAAGRSSMSRVNPRFWDSGF